jgi:prepilin-type N-terminal cleavage/methylation domain-containing protein
MIQNRGFTLIELLVVIAIIGLMSAIVLASLNTARNKGKDGAIRAEMSEVATLMAENYLDYGSYCNIQPAVWVPVSGSCAQLLADGSSGGFSGTYAQQIANICQAIVNNAANNFNGGGYQLLIYTSPSTCASTYSWDAQLNDGNWYCTGSSGITAEYPSYSGAGCYNNP